MLGSGHSLLKYFFFARGEGGGGLSSLHKIAKKRKQIDLKFL